MRRWPPRTPGRSRSPPPGRRALSETELAALTERAAGNALFIRELAVSPPGDDALPETVESLLTNRIDTLHPSDRLLLRHASVIGASFDLDLLTETLDEEAADPEQWDRLADFVDWEGPVRLRFRHDLVRAAAYDGLSFTRRREIHARVGEAIERRTADPAAEAGVLSLHFFEAAEWEKAWLYALRGGDDARSKYANVDAATFYERALTAAVSLEPPEQEVARVQEALGDVRELFASYDEADGAYVQASKHGGPAARLLRKRGRVAERQGRYDDALALYDAGTAEADANERIALQLGRAIVLYHQGTSTTPRSRPSRRQKPRWPSTTGRRSQTRTGSGRSPRPSAAGRHASSSSSRCRSSRSSASSRCR